MSACSIDSRPIDNHAIDASAAPGLADGGDGGDASRGRDSARELAALAKRVHDSGGPLELARDAGTPREVVDGGGALPPVDASTNAGAELVDAGVHVDAGDASSAHDAGELVDAARCPFRCQGACSVWPCP